MFGINFLRNLFTPQKQKPEAAMSNFGVFIRSAQSDVAIIDKCRQLLQSFQSDSKILHVMRDPVHNGLKVFFNSGSAVDELLKKKALSEGDASSTIHSLATALSVHEAFPNNEEEFKEAIREKIRNVISVQVLDIKKVPIDLKYPDIGTGKWIIVLDIPEIDELAEFKKMGLPSNMALKFPFNDDYHRVEFHCRLCQKDGHVQNRCLDSDTPHSSSTSSNSRRSYEGIRDIKPTGLFINRNVPHLPETSNSSVSPADPEVQQNVVVQKRMPSSSPSPSPKRVPGGFRIRDRAEEMTDPVPRPSILIDHLDVEELASEIGREEVRRSLSIHDGIKQETDVQISSPLNWSNTNNGSNYQRHRSSNENFSSSRVSSEVLGENSNASASSTTIDKDSLEIIYVSNPLHRTEHIQNTPDNSPVVTTTNHQPSIKREISSTNDDEDSNQHTPTTLAAPQRAKKKTMTMLPVVIPPRIRDIVSGMPRGALDIRQLEAFFNHVKKKSRPSDFAEMYTQDVEGLHSQLVAISRLYYMSPNVGSKQDIQFMKMLGNVLKRFYNTPAQRRPMRP